MSDLDSDLVQRPGRDEASFPSPFEDASIGDPYSKHEIDMQALSYTIRSKPDWLRKSKDKKIVKTWKEEGMEKTKTSWGAPLSQEMFKYVVDELALHAERAKTGIEAGCFDRIWQSDNLIPNDLRQCLIERVKTELETVSEEKRDWHPGSQQQVLDLVHPSLYPLRYDITSICLDPSSSTEKGVKIAEPPKYRVYGYGFSSSKHAWLPSECRVDEKGQVTIDSYINNLHPTLHASLYPVLAAILSRFVPLFERVLSNLQSPPPRRIKVSFDDPDEAIQYDVYDWDVTTYKVPQPARFNFRRARNADEVTYSLKGKTIQVIVKLANIQLTPERPRYHGGVWHVEGMENESIVASGIYYYDSENIEESRLAFRGAVSEDMLWGGGDEQARKGGVGVVYGIDDSLNQHFNSIVASAGRAIAFPNILQHKVARFGLVDHTKPGHRKILVFFLVDPTKRIPSTVNVAPQQREWIEHEIYKPRISSPENKLPPLPNELWTKILDFAELMTFGDAREVREELMKERKFAADSNSEYMFEREFSMCEH